MKRVDGHECPACGCADTDVIRTYPRGDAKVSRCICNHCSRVFLVTERDAEEISGEAP
jgi:hypothetical protein